jgi:hypothetical protein
MFNTTDSSTAAVIQLADSELDGTKRRIPCSFRKFDNKRLQLEVPESLKYACAISVEYNDALFLGDVVGCTRTNGTWDIDVQVKQVLSGLQSLMTLRDRLVGESVRVSPVEAPEAVRVPVKTSVA